MVTAKTAQSGGSVSTGSSNVQASPAAGLVQPHPLKCCGVWTQQPSGHSLISPHETLKCSPHWRGAMGLPQYQVLARVFPLGHQG